MRTIEQIDADIAAARETIARCEAEKAEAEKARRGPLRLVVDGQYIDIPDGEYVARVHRPNMASTYDPTALAHKFAAADYLYWYCKWTEQCSFMWNFFMKNEFSIDVPCAPHSARDYALAIAEGREPTAEQKAAWGITS